MPAPIDVASHPFFACFPAEKAAVMQKAAELVHLESGALIFRERDPSDTVYLVFQGEVTLMKETPGSQHPVDIAALGPGEYFGELGLLDGRPRSTSARITQPAVLARIGVEAFHEALSGAPAETFRALVSRISSNLRKANDLLLAETLRKEKMALVGEMANAIVHDLRSPFTIIGLACQTISARNDDPDTGKFCTMIEKQVDRMSAMVSEILEFSKGTTQLDRKPVTIPHLFETFASYNHLELERKQVDFELSPIEETVLCDEEKILRVLQNLFNNALDALRGGGGRIHLSAHRAGDRVDIHLADDGPGIPEAIRSTLFEPFVTMGKAKGTGLGLAIARAVVTAHDGEISFESTTGTGTTFKISLPVASPDSHS